MTSSAKRDTQSASVVVCVIRPILFPCVTLLTAATSAVSRRLPAVRW